MLRLYPVDPLCRPVCDRSCRGTGSERQQLPTADPVVDAVAEEVRVPVPDRGAPSSWVSTAQMPFTVESLPPLRRRLLTDVHAHDITEDAAYDAALVLAELVSNALKHARPLRDGGLQLAWGCWDDHLHVRVTDGGASTAPLAEVSGPAATSGRGLSIVREVATEWGVERQPAATTVWATLPAPMAAGPRGVSGERSRSSPARHD